MKEDDDLGDSVTQISLKALESQKRKQRNKKHKKKKPINNKSSEDNLEDDVEKSVREVNRILGKNEFRRVSPFFANLAYMPHIQNHLDFPYKICAIFLIGFDVNLVNVKTNEEDCANFVTLSEKLNFISTKVVT